MEEDKKKNIKFVKIVSPGKKEIRFKNGENEEIIKIIDPSLSSEVRIEKDIELRDENVQEILTSVPHWMVRWGNILFLVLLLLILFLAWLIKYPDVVEGKVTVEKPASSAFFVAKIRSKDYSFQKVKTGQEVHISLFAYPETDNGILKGVVDSIYWDKKSQSYFSRIKLPENLRTTYGHNIDSNTNLNGMAKIIIEDKRLIDRLFKL